MITHKEYCWHFNGRAMLKIDKNTEKNNIKKINKNIVLKHNINLIMALEPRKNIPPLLLSVIAILNASFVLSKVLVFV